MNMSPTLVWVNLGRGDQQGWRDNEQVVGTVGRVSDLEGSILLSTQVTKTAVGTGLSLTSLNCSSMFFWCVIRYFMMPSSILVMPVLLLPILKASVHFQGHKTVILSEVEIKMENSSTGFWLQ